MIGMEKKWKRMAKKEILILGKETFGCDSFRTV
jgi:hypothetical protein